MFPKVLRGRLGKAAQNLDGKEVGAGRRTSCSGEKSWYLRAPWDVCSCVSPLPVSYPSMMLSVSPSTLGPSTPLDPKSKNVSASSIKSLNGSQTLSWALPLCPSLLSSSLAFALTPSGHIPNSSSHHADSLPLTLPGEHPDPQQLVWFHYQDHMEIPQQCYRACLHRVRPQ